MMEQRTLNVGKKSEIFNGDFLNMTEKLMGLVESGLT